MAEFCKECFKRIEGDFFKDKEIILSEDDDLCEGCGEFKQVVIGVATIDNKSNKGLA